MMKKTLFLAGVLVPVSAFALSIQPGDFYDDVRPDAPEAAGINLLTRENVVQGYGDHVFGPNRLVNRAEFLKIAILSTPESMRPKTADGVGCFPDVPASAWFAPAVCAAKNAGVVKGNPDGLFHPERTVQYDEALKMLSLLYGYEIYPGSGKDWGEPYYNAAVNHGTDLPIRITFANPLTRALSARLAAAFIAEHAGQLPAFRLAEHGEYASSSSSVSSSVSSASSSSSSSSSSVSSSAPADVLTLPPVPHFLVTGEESDAIASGVLRSNGETAKVALAEVKLFNEVRSIDHLEIVKTDGTVVASLSRKITTDTTDYKQTFQATIQPEDRYTIPADTDVPLVLRAVIRSDANAGFSEELLQVRTFNVTIIGDDTNHSLNVPFPGAFPKHQTSFGRITSVTRLSPVSAPIASSGGLLLGSFQIAGSVIPGKSLALTTLTFSLYQAGFVTLSNVMILNHTTGVSAACTVNSQAMTIYCPNLAGTVGPFQASGSIVVDLKADVAVQAGSTNAALEASLETPGSPEEIGAIEWTDSSGMFRWIEHQGSPIVHGTRYQ